VSVSFNADEVFAVAERIEQNGAAFYRAAAGQVRGPVVEILRDLAAWEDQHQKFFASLRAELAAGHSEATVSDPDDEAVQYVRAMADSAVFKPQEDPMQTVGPNPTGSDILCAALQRERDAIAYFIGVRELVPPKLGQERIDGIIKEEMRHVTMITERLAELG
jgi:rubrerythrin